MCLKGLYVCNNFFKHRSLYKYAIVARGQDGVKVKRMINMVLVKKIMYCAMYWMRGQ